MKTDIISPEEAGTLYGLFQQRLKHSADQAAYSTYSDHDKAWHAITWQQAADEVARWQTALAAENLQAGDRVALNLRNCKEWVFFDMAAISLGLVVVPLYPDDRPDNVAYILQDADVKLLLLQHSNQWKRLQPALSEQHNLQRVVILHQDNDVSPSTPQVIYADEWLPDQARHVDIHASDPHALASIIYTSGTTGRPKGVMLSHHNMMSVAYGALSFFDIFDDDVFLSFLPLSHTFERTAGYYLPMMAGASIAYARGIPQLAEDMRIVKPTIMFAVPRIFERIHHRLQSQLAQKSVLSRMLFRLTVSIGWARFNYKQGRGGWHPGFLLWPILRKKVADKVHQLLGGNVRIAVSGGAALPFRTAKLFTGLGFCLLQGYGLTETSPIISVNEPDNNRPDSVGRPILGVTAKIGEDNELLVKGPGNMLGYWNNHKATAQIINAEGWLHTGDQARIGETGHIYITGRLKDILVLSNGEKIPPADIEQAILMDDIFEQALILGEGQAYLAALLVLNGEHWFNLAKQFNLNAMDANSLNSKELHTYILHRLRTLLHDFPAYAKVRRVTLSLEPFSVENGLLTATMKIKRQNVFAQYQSDIDAMFD